jgi:hypothetical protein
MGAQADTNLIMGGVFLVVGLAVTFGTYAAGGRTFIIASGAILFGGIQFLAGLIGVLQQKSSDEHVPSHYMKQPDRSKSSKVGGWVVFVGSVSFVFLILYFVLSSFSSR